MTLKTSDIDFNIDILNTLPKDFSIVVDNTTYKLHTFRLVAFSPRIRRLIVCDPCIRRIKIPFPDPNHAFELISKLIYQQEIEIEDSNLKTFLKYVEFFENHEFAKLVASHLQKIDSNIESLQKIDYNSSYLMLIMPIEKIKMDFEKFMESSFMLTLPVHILDEILPLQFQKQNIKASLFEWIYNLVEHNFDNNISYCSLFCHLKFEELSEEQLEQFVKICHPDAISGALWMAVSERLMKPVNTNKQNENFPYKGDSFNGVFHYFIENYKDSFTNYINLDCGGTKQWALQHLLEPNNHSKWWENAGNNGRYEQEDAWVGVYFSRTKLRLTHYTLSHSLNSANSCQPKHWIVYGSDESEEWVKLHEVTNAVELNHEQAYHTYKISNSTEYYSRFKIEQIQNFSKKDLYRGKFVLCAIEFFGDLTKLE